MRRFLLFEPGPKSGYRPTPENCGIPFEKSPDAFSLTIVFLFYSFVLCFLNFLSISLKPLTPFHLQVMAGDLEMRGPWPPYDKILRPWRRYNATMPPSPPCDSALRASIDCGGKLGHLARAS
jgi:hypothetical protein